MTAQELRSKYLKFFESRGHVIVPSSSLVPENDATTLFTGSGMQPMIPYLLGAKHPQGNRITDSQRAFRADDIEEVGDNRHTTFFEMLGNWSFGEYFKQEQISWMYEFLVKECGLNPQNLYISVFRGDDTISISRDSESVELWQSLFKADGIEAKDADFPEKEGMQNARIFYYPAKKNWWSRSGPPSNMPIGEPGGPDTEMFWDFGEHLGLHEKSEWKDEVCHVNCDCGRFMEIGNNVFMEYVKTEKGFEKLKQRNVDFGGGLERMLSAINNDVDSFKSDLLWPIIEYLQSVTGTSYGSDTEVTRQMRIVADHVRAAVFMAYDGVVPNNKDRGYIMRRLLRRAMVAVKKLGATGDWVQGAVSTVIRIFHDSYPELSENSARIIQTIEDEKNRFSATLDKGLKEFNKILQTRTISGNDAFNLYQTFGFPWELTRDLAKEAGQSPDEEEYKAEFQKHKDLSRTASAGDFKGGLGGTGEIYTRYHTATHLMQKALRQVLGEDVWQKGSNITDQRTRFDFTYPQKMTDEQKQQVEDLVNSWITRDLQVKREVVPLEEARARGAIGLFGEKYGDTVSIYTVFDPKTEEIISVEFCGGPHVEHTGVIGKFKIQKEEAVSAGVRRIKAVIG